MLLLQRDAHLVRGQEEEYDISRESTLYAKDGLCAILRHRDNPHASRLLIGCMPKPQPAKAGSTHDPWLLRHYRTEVDPFFGSFGDTENKTTNPIME
jgi:hypothetical protein